MALIICPECGGNVSDKAEKCIHCGYPLNEIKEAMEKDNVYSLVLTGYKGRTDTDKLRNETNAEINIKTYLLKDGYEARKLMRQLPATIITGLEKETGDYLVKDFDRDGCITELVEAKGIAKHEYSLNKRIRERMKEFPLDGKVHCPKCKGTDIDVVQKGYGLLRGFVGSNKPMNVCKKCGYKWEARGR